MRNIDFSAGFNDADKAAEIVAQIQVVFDELTESNEKSLAQAKSASADLNGALELNEVLTASNISLADAIKSVHMVLNSKLELISQDADLLNITKELGKWVMGSGSIKLGVASEALREADQ